MNNIIAYADANGVIGFAPTCPPHGLGFANGPSETVKEVVERFAEKLDGSLLIPDFGPTANNVEALISFGARVRAACAAENVPEATIRERLEAAREAAAQRAYENYDFPAEVVNHTGWERIFGDSEWRRHVFLQGKTPDGPSELGCFTVTFTKDAALIADLSYTSR